MDLRTTALVRQLPPEVGGGSAWYLSGWNYSDDLFMFLRRGLGRDDGIRPNQNYLATFRVTLATNASRECVGIGGQPGESVFIKLGAAPVRPEPAADSYYRPAAIRMNVDKGNQSDGGVHASAAGTISAEVTLPCSSNAPFAELVRQHQHPYAIRAAASGELWLLFGVDSGFEGFNSIYVQAIDVTLTPVADSDPRARWQKTYADVAALVGQLRAHVDLHESGATDFDVIGGRAVHYAIGPPGTREELWVFVFDTAEAAERARGLISADGSQIGVTSVEWIGPPHFFMGDHFIVNYAGSSADVLALLTERFGAQFAGR